ncbi:LytR/AlgR family response regulator transcription factor [Mucilaginibacter lacusdianchii]|uniref:LytR/AlgR family response regulator transcription factor n=1 Tax=Mucilaginibacter lacusdianchii TaxID=2684211 RepID=UPI00131EA77D|nr:LytTR family DNA-binding domain-containing protein [Mucilaginibacter sp. JXJ CY 39]
MIKAIIVEDSRLARIELKELLRAHPEIEVIGETDLVSQALELIRILAPDLIFLDIHLPGASGFDILQQLQQLPAVIFTTAFEQYALQSYDYHATDYLLKPIVPERLARAVQKTLLNLNTLPIKASTPSAHDRIFIKDQQKTWLVPLKDIRYFESKGNYSQVQFAGNSPLILRSLQQLEETLNPNQFMRVNRQQIVNLNHVIKVDQVYGNRLILVLSDGTQIEVSRRQVARFKEVFSLF